MKKIRFGLILFILSVALAAASWAQNVGEALWLAQ